jgi:hypothetical protein
MSKQDLSDLKVIFNSKKHVEAFVNILSEKQKVLVNKLLNANTLEDVKKAQGAWFELENLKSLREQIVGAEKNG